MASKWVCSGSWHPKGGCSGSWPRHGCAQDHGLNMDVLRIMAPQRGVLRIISPKRGVFRIMASKEGQIGSPSTIGSKSTVGKVRSGSARQVDVANILHIGTDHQGTHNADAHCALALDAAKSPASCIMIPGGCLHLLASGISVHG